jgi:hypothetical protein
MLRPRTLVIAPALLLVTEFALLADATFVLVGQFRVIAKATGVLLLLAAALLLLTELAGFPVTLRFTLVTKTVFAHTGFLLAELVELALPVSF